MTDKRIHRVPIVLRTDEDADLVEWIESIEKGQRSHQIRQILRQALADEQAGKPVDAKELRRILREELTRAGVT